MRRSNYRAYQKGSQKKARQQIFLSPNEYAMVMSAFNSHMTKEERALRVVSKPIGEFIYTIINNGYNDYVIIAKYPIEDVDEDWEDKE